MLVEHPKFTSEISSQLYSYCCLDDDGYYHDLQYYKHVGSQLFLDTETGKVIFRTDFEIPIDTQLELKLADDPYDVYKSNPQYFIDLLEEERQAKEKARLLKIKLDKLVIENNKRIAKERI